jgi:RNA polymerase sigma factor FliA
LTPAERSALVEAHIPMLRAIAAEMTKRYPRHSFHDLFGAGALGMCMAARRFRPEHGVAFAGYAWPRVKGAMLDWMRIEGPYTRGMVARARHADPEAILVGLEAIAEMPAGGPPPDEMLSDGQALARAHAALAAMEPRTRRLMDLMYRDGLDGKAAGDVVGVTKSRVCQLRKMAIRELQDAA